MRLLFVSSTMIGGSGRSQRELASELVALGHDVHFLVDDARRARLARWCYGHLADASVRYRGKPIATLLRALREVPGRRVETTYVEGLPHDVTPLPQNALATRLKAYEPDVVIGNSLERWQWRMVLAMCRAAAVPVILYIREDDSLKHLAGDSPDAVVANAESLCQAVRSQGTDCTFIPSVIDVSVTRTESTRQVALAINPIQSRGVDIVVKIAERAPDIPVVLQESWPLTTTQLAAIGPHLDRLPNLELRHARPPGPELYGDAKVVLVPYRVDNRPRVIAEAQASAIPVLVGNVPALVEATGPGGAIVELEDIDAWVAELRRMWTDGNYYESLCRAADSHGRRPDIDPIAVAAQFLAVVERVARNRRPPLAPAL
jgi:glycosyltransferase involved in cell wall biosynthesis